MDFISYVILGLSPGSIYALIALGYTMVYGIARMLNFAHGDVIMIGGYAALTATKAMGLPVWAAICVSIVVCVVLGILVEKVAYKPLRKATPLAILITAIGVSYLLQNAALLKFGAEETFPRMVPNFSVSLFGLDISGITIITVAVALVILVALMIFMKKTKTGRAMLAVSEDKGAAQLMGINVNRTISITFAIGSGLAAIAGILYYSSTTYLSPYTGSMPGIKAFTAAVFGGIGSIPGAMIGGILLGVIESLGTRYISSQLADAIVFGVLIIVLIFKPTGLFGKKLNEKV